MAGSIKEEISKIVRVVLIKEHQNPEGDKPEHSEEKPEPNNQNSEGQQKGEWKMSPESDELLRQIQAMLNTYFGFENN